MDHLGGNDGMKRDVGKMKTEYKRVKEEINHARQHGEKLSKRVNMTEKKAREMQRELELADSVLRDLTFSD